MAERAVSREELIKTLIKKIEEYPGSLVEDGVTGDVVTGCCKNENTYEHRDDCIIENMRKLILLLAKKEIT